MKQRVAFPLAVVFCATVLLSLAGLIGSCRSTPSEARLFVIGLTNIPGRGDFAIFACTNQSATPICFLVDSYDEISGGTWKTNCLDDGKGAIKAEARIWLSQFIGTPSRMEVNSGAVFYVPVPVTNNAWRARFLCVEQTMGDRLRQVVGFDAELSAHTIVLGKGQYFSGRSYKLLSTEIPK
jgi:hypothetical protein